MHIAHTEIENKRQNDLNKQSKPLSIQVEFAAAIHIASFFRVFVHLLAFQIQKRNLYLKMSRKRREKQMFVAFIKFTTLINFVVLQYQILKITKRTIDKEKQKEILSEKIMKGISIIYILNGIFSKLFGMMQKT